MPEKSLATEPITVATHFKSGDFENILNRVNGIYESIARRAFELFETSGRMFGHDLDDWLKAESELLHPVHVSLVESDEALTVQAEIPGFSAKDLEVSVEPMRLTITGKRETKEEHKKGKTIYSERYADQILRVLDLPAAVDTSKVTATLKNGVIELEMRKAASAKKVPIEAKAS